MRRYPKPMSELPSKQEETHTVSDGFDVQKEIENLEEVVRREVKNLMAESTKGKLSEKSARDLVNYLKELRGIRDEQKNQIKDISTEEIKKLIEE